MSSIRRDRVDRLSAARAALSRRGRTLVRLRSGRGGHALRVVVRFAVDGALCGVRSAGACEAGNRFGQAVMARRRWNRHHTARDAHKGLLKRYGMCQSNVWRCARTLFRLSPYPISWHDSETLRGSGLNNDEAETTPCRGRVGLGEAATPVGGLGRDRCADEFRMCGGPPGRRSPRRRATSRNPRGPVWRSTRRRRSR